MPIRWCSERTASPMRPSAQTTASPSDKTVETNEEQRNALHAYRQAMLAYGDAALDIAEKEAWPLARRSTMRALFGVFTGTSDRAERSIEHDSAQLERKVTAACPQLRGALAAQQSLERLLPAFRPYAGLDRKEVAPCLD